MNKNRVFFVVASFLLFCLFCIAVDLFSKEKELVYQTTVQTKTIDEYIIINVRLEHSADGSDFFMFDYAKNGEPMTVYLPHAESVETFTNRLELLGHVVWLCDEKP